jgi:hypothetical protein
VNKESQNLKMDKLVKEFEGEGWNRAGSVALALACQATLRVRIFIAKYVTSALKCCYLTTVSRDFLALYMQHFWSLSVSETCQMAQLLAWKVQEKVSNRTYFS